MPVRLVPESNVVHKNWRKVDVKIALCYPNVYRTGMTGFSIRLLYALLNSCEDVVCERFFIPTRNEQLRSLESNQPMKKFDVVAFSLQYEEDYVNAIRMLFESQIPPRRRDRVKNGPLIIAGGPCATENPEPLAEYIDLFAIGEAEPLLDSFLERVKEFENPTRRIEEFADIKGIYVPEVSNSAERVWIEDLNRAPHPLAQQVPLVDARSPYMTIFGKTFVVEAVRGCGRGCRFCLIGYIGRPKRERSLAKIEDILTEGMKYTPVRKVSLIGAGTSDHSRLEEICEFVVSNGWEISIPSIRPEAVTEKLAKALVKGKQRRVALAPDGATQCMRNVINKNIQEEQIVEAAKILLEQGVKQLKLYYIIGLPRESFEDVKEIFNLSKRVADLGYSSVHVSVNPLIPKPHTPFQWAAFPSIKYIREFISWLRQSFREDLRFRMNRLDPRHAQIQAALSLGDRKIGKAVELAAFYGGSLGTWRKALKETGLSLNKYLRSKSIKETLPWDHIRIGLNKSFLIEEVEKAFSEATTPPCENECMRCGVC